MIGTSLYFPTSFLLFCFAVSLLCLLPFSLLIIFFVAYFLSSLLTFSLSHHKFQRTTIRSLSLQLYLFHSLSHISFSYTNSLTPTLFILYQCLSFIPSGASQSVMFVILEALSEAFRIRDTLFTLTILYLVRYFLEVLLQRKRHTYNS